MMKNQHRHLIYGFTLLETVIAIGVLAVLLSGFVVVFAPAAEGIRKSISVDDGDRLVSALEKELTNLRPGEESGTNIVSGFDKCYLWIQDSMKTRPDMVFVYQYQGDLAQNPRNDGSYMPYTKSNGVAGKDYIVATAVRRLNAISGGKDPWLEADLSALVGRVYAVKLNQLVFNQSELVESKKALIEDPSPSGNEPLLSGSSVSGKYQEGAIACTASFYFLPSKTYSYINNFDSSKLKTPMFIRNLAILR
jgi:hypothetical protein